MNNDKTLLRLELDDLLILFNGHYRGNALLVTGQLRSAKDEYIRRSPTAILPGDFVRIRGGQKNYFAIGQVVEVDRRSNFYWVRFEGRDRALKYREDAFDKLTSKPTSYFVTAVHNNPFGKMKIFNLRIFNPYDLVLQYHFIRDSVTEWLEGMYVQPLPQQDSRNPARRGQDTYSVSWLTSKAAKLERNVYRYALSDHPLANHHVIDDSLDAHLYYTAALYARMYGGGVVTNDEFHAILAWLEANWILETENDPVIIQKGKEKLERVKGILGLG